MADFLTRLAARSLGQLQSMQPRRASRFEPDATTVGMDTSGVFEIEAEREQPASQPAPANRGPILRPMEDQPDESEASLSPRQTEAEPVAAEEQAAAPDVPDDVSEMRPVRYVSEPGTVAERQRIASPAQRSPEVAPSAPRARYEPLGLDHPLEPRSELLEMQPPPEAPARFAPASAVEVEPATEEEAQPGDSGHRERSEPLHPIRDDAGDVVRAATRAVVPGEGPEEGTATRARPVPEVAPQIAVSIGRIEVKAAPPPQPARPAQPPARPQPSLSLGEYLERSRRRRR